MRSEHERRAAREGRAGGAAQRLASFELLEIAAVSLDPISASKNATGGDGTSRVYALNLSTTEVKLFASPQSIDLATGLAAGGSLRNADNLAIDQTSSKIAAVARTTTSGSPPTGTRTATSWMRERAWPAGPRTARSARSSPVSTSISGIPTGLSSTSSIRRAVSTA